MRTIRRKIVPISRSLELPDGYQHFDWYEPGTYNHHDVWFNAPVALKSMLQKTEGELYLYTQHQIFQNEQQQFLQTRSSPNWEGGLVTYATCKHNMRTYNREWLVTWIAGLTPSH